MQKRYKEKTKKKASVQ